MGSRQYDVLESTLDAARRTLELYDERRTLRRVVGKWSQAREIQRRCRSLVTLRLGPGEINLSVLLRVGGAWTIGAAAIVLLIKDKVPQPFPPLVTWAAAEGARATM